MLPVWLSLFLSSICNCLSTRGMFKQMKANQLLASSQCLHATIASSFLILFTDLTHATVIRRTKGEKNENFKMSSTRTFLISTCTRSQPCLTQEFAFCPAKELKRGTCYLPQTWKSRGTMISEPVSCLLKVSESKYLNCYEFTFVFRAYFLFSTLPKISRASKHDSLSSFLLPSQHLIVVGTIQNREWLRIFITGFLTKNLK